VLPRPRVGLPLWSAIAIVGAAYLVRSAARGSLAPDWPLDLVVLVMLVAVIAIVAFVRAQARSGSDEWADESPGADDDPASHVR
jgi:hypothetical protein